MAHTIGNLAQHREEHVRQGVVWSVILLAWGLAVLAALTNTEWVLSHHVLIEESNLPWIATLFLFLAAWQVMTAGMMLPSSLPMTQMFFDVSRHQERTNLVRFSFLAAYFAVWSGFAVAAFVADTGLHALVHRWGWLDQHSFIIAGTTLVIAGAFQFSALKERCLTACRSPRSFLWRFYQRGAGGAWKLGVRHGVFCLGCCWALMLTMFGLGIGNLAWMAGMTGVMVIEKVSVRGRRFASVIGVVLLAWGAVVFLQPAWLPAVLGGI